MCHCPCHLTDSCCDSPPGVVAWQVWRRQRSPSGQEFHPGAGPPAASPGMVAVSLSTLPLPQASAGVQSPQPGMGQGSHIVLGSTAVAAPGPEGAGQGLQLPFEGCDPSLSLPSTPRAAVRAAPGHCGRLGSWGAEHRHTGRLCLPG